MMDTQQTIIGAGLISGAILIIKSYIAGGSIAKPFLGIAIATILLAALDTVGLGSIASLMALLLAGTVVTYYAVPLLEKLNGVF